MAAGTKIITQNLRGERFAVVLLGKRWEIFRSAWFGLQGVVGVELDWQNKSEKYPFQRLGGLPYIKLVIFRQHSCSGRKVLGFVVVCLICICSEDCWHWVWFVILGRVPRAGESISTSLSPF